MLALGAVAYDRNRQATRYLRAQLLTVVRQQARQKLADIVAREAAAADQCQLARASIRLTMADTGRPTSRVLKTLEISDAASRP